LEEQPDRQGRSALALPAPGRETVLDQRQLEVAVRRALEAVAQEGEQRADLDAGEGLGGQRLRLEGLGSQVRPRRRWPGRRVRRACRRRSLAARSSTCRGTWCRSGPRPGPAAGRWDRATPAGRRW